MLSDCFTYAPKKLSSPEFDTLHLTTATATAATTILPTISSRLVARGAVWLSSLSHTQQTARSPAFYENFCKTLDNTFFLWYTLPRIKYYEVRLSMPVITDNVSPNCPETVRSYLKDCGVRSTVSSGLKLKLNPKLFPSVSYSKPRDCFVLYFQSLHRYGEQSFFFDEFSTFLYPEDSDPDDEERPKRTNRTSGDDPLFLKFTSQDELDNAPFSEQRDFCLAVIKRFFSISSTVLNTARHQDKKRHRRIPLQPKPATVKSALGIPKEVRFVPVVTFDDNGQPVTIHVPNPKQRKKLQLPDFADYYVELAAKDYDFNWFTPFWNEYVVSKGRKAVKRREREKLEQLFKDRVLSLQGRKESV